MQISRLRVCVTQSQDWNAISGFWERAKQSWDCTNSQIMRNIYTFFLLVFVGSTHLTFVSSASVHYTPELTQLHKACLHKDGPCKYSVRYHRLTSTSLQLSNNFWFSHHRWWTPFLPSSWSAPTMWLNFTWVVTAWLTACPEWDHPYNHWPRKRYLAACWTWWLDVWQCVSSPETA